MKRLLNIAAIAGLATVSGFAQTELQDNDARAAQVQQSPGSQVQSQQAQSQQMQAQQIQQRVIDLYLSDFRREVDLSEEQFLNVSPDIRRFIQKRFADANQRRELNRRQDELLSQPNPSQTDVQKLNEDQAQLDSEAGMLETRLIRKLRSELSDRQLLLVRAFNRKFFDEKLPTLVEQARNAAANAARGQRQQQQQQRPALADKPNQNQQNPNRGRGQVRPGTAFGGKE